MIFTNSKIVRLLTFIAVVLILFGSFHLISSPNSKNEVQTIVIDAGHGGKDPGAIGSFSYEKDINLQVSLKLGRMLSQKYPNKRILYTRTSDTYPSLKDRHALANKENGDLFISIHVNSTSGTYRKVRLSNGRYKTVRDRSTERRGTESYVLGLHRNDQKEDAIQDHADMIVDENGMLDPSSPLTAIIIAQYSQAYLARSINLATYIEREFAQQGRRSEGVKQKGLEVLAGSAMPGVLVEIGFINNPQDELYLTSDAGQRYTAQAIMNGVEKYIKDCNANKINN